MHDGIVESSICGRVFGQIRFLADEAVFLSHSAALDSVRILLCKYGLPPKTRRQINNRFLCLLVYVLVMFDCLLNSPLDVMISAVRSFVDITLIFNLILIFLYGCGCPGVS